MPGNSMMMVYVLHTGAKISGTVVVCKESVRWLTFY